MGLSHEQYANELKRLNPVPKEDPAEEKTIEVDRTGFMDPEVQRGFPICGPRGFPGGATIKGTRPGDSAKALEQAGRDIVRATLDRNRYRPQEQA